MGNPQPRGSNNKHIPTKQQDRLLTYNNCKIKRSKYHGLNGQNVEWLGKRQPKLKLKSTKEKKEKEKVK